MTRIKGIGNRLPEVGAGFVWDEIDGETPVVRPNAEGVVAAFTTRIGGASSPPYDELNLSYMVGDSEEIVRDNRERAARAVGSSAPWSVVRQVHGSGVVPVPEPGPIPEADGQWTEDPARTLAVFAADCVPVLVAGRGRLGVAHAGWRGLAAGVVERTIEATGGRPEVFAGPAIGPCCYEVGDEVVDAFTAVFGDDVVPEPRRVDLWAAAQAAAERVGAASFVAVRLCTMCNFGLFFSHRRDRGRTGRQALIARMSS